MAGLAAARELAATGARVVVLEGRARTGGRVWTEHAAGWETPIELGAEFVHGEPAELFALVRAAGATLDDADADHLRKTDRGFDSGDGSWGEIGAVLGRARRRKKDCSIAELIASAKMSKDGARMLSGFVEGFHGGAIERISARSVALQTFEEPQFRVREGYGKVLAWVEADARRHGAEIQCGRTVRRVEWKAGAATALGEGLSLAARAVLLAVPISILQDGIEIRPDIGRARSAGVEMGAALRVVLRFAEPMRPADVPRGAFVHAPDLEIPTFWLGPDEREPRITAWCGGPRAARIGAQGPEEIRRVAIRSAAAALDVEPERFAKKLLGAHAHSFPADPFSRGGYPYQRVGADLSGAFDPEAGTIFFAGDYTDPAELGTVGAAARSGTTAARAIREAMD